MNIKKSIDELCSRANKSRLDVGDYDIRQKNDMLKNLCQLIKQNESKIISFNKKDLVIAKRKQLSDSFIDRMTLSPDRINSMINCIRHIIKLPDPLYKKTKTTKNAFGYFQRLEHLLRVGTIIEL